MQITILFYSKMSIDKRGINEYYGPGIGGRSENLPSLVEIG
jgi:hypothetical protein